MTYVKQEWRNKEDGPPFTDIDKASLDHIEAGIAAADAKAHAAVTDTITALSSLTRTDPAPAPLIRLADNGATGQPTLALLDTPTHGHDLLYIDHFGNGTTGPTTQAYGINIANNVGARPAFVIHQYSAVGSAVRIDNTDIAPAIQIWNTENQSKNPGKTGTGAFFQLRPFGEGTGYLYLANDLTWLNTSTKNFTVQSTAATAYTLGVDTAQNIPALYVTKTGTGAGAPIYITNAGTSPGVDLYQNGATGLGFRVTAATGHTTYAFQVRGQSFGGAFETSQSATNTMALLVDKKGTAAGEVARFINRGTGASISVRDGALTEVARIGPDGEYENGTAGKGVVLRSPDGTRYRMTVSNGGVVTVAPA